MITVELAHHDAMAAFNCTISHLCKDGATPVIDMAMLAAAKAAPHWASTGLSTSAVTLNMTYNCFLLLSGSDQLWRRLEEGQRQSTVQQVSTAPPGAMIALWHFRSRSLTQRTPVIAIRCDSHLRIYEREDTRATAERFAPLHAPYDNCYHGTIDDKSLFAEGTDAVASQNKFLTKGFRLPNASITQPSCGDECSTPSICQLGRSAFATAVTSCVRHGRATGTPHCFDQALHASLKRCLSATEMDNRRHALGLSQNTLASPTHQCRMADHEGVSLVLLDCANHRVLYYPPNLLQLRAELRNRCVVYVRASAHHVVQFAPDGEVRLRKVRNIRKWLQTTLTPKQQPRWYSADSGEAYGTPSPPTTPASGMQEQERDPPGVASVEVAEPRPMVEQAWSVLEDVHHVASMTANDISATFHGMTMLARRRLRTSMVRTVTRVEETSDVCNDTRSYTPGGSGIGAYSPFQMGAQSHSSAYYPPQLHPQPPSPPPTPPAAADNDDQHTPEVNVRGATTGTAHATVAAQAATLAMPSLQLPDSGSVHVGASPGYPRATCSFSGLPASGLPPPESQVDNTPGGAPAVSEQLSGAHRTYTDTTLHALQLVRIQRALEAWRESWTRVKRRQVHQRKLAARMSRLASEYTQPFADAAAEAWLAERWVRWCHEARLRRAQRDVARAQLASRRSSMASHAAGDTLRPQALPTAVPHRVTRTPSSSVELENRMAAVVSRGMASLGRTASAQDETRTPVHPTVLADSSSVTVTHGAVSLDEKLRIIPSKSPSSTASAASVVQEQREATATALRELEQQRQRSAAAMVTQQRAAEAAMAQALAEQRTAAAQQTAQAVAVATEKAMQAAQALADIKHKDQSDGAAKAVQEAQANSLRMSDTMASLAARLTESDQKRADAQLEATQKLAEAKAAYEASELAMAKQLASMQDELRGAKDAGDLAASGYQRHSSSSRPASQVGAVPPATPSNPARSSQPPYTQRTPGVVDATHVALPGQSCVAAPVTATRIVAPVDPTAPVVVLLQFTLVHNAPPLEICMYGAAAQAMANGGRAANLEALVVGHHAFAMPRPAELWELSAGEVAEIAIEETCRYLATSVYAHMIGYADGPGEFVATHVSATASPLANYPGNWAPPDRMAQPAGLILVRVHHIPVALVERMIRNSSLVLTADAILMKWHSHPSAPDALKAEMAMVAAGLTRCHVQDDDELGVLSILYDLITSGPDIAKPIFTLNRRERQPAVTGDLSVDHDRRNFRFPDIRRFLYFQFQELPHSPLKEWPARVSMQLWHLNILVYLSSGAIGVSFPLLREFGPEMLITNIVTLVIDRAVARYERLRSCYSTRNEETSQLVHQNVQSIMTATTRGGDRDIQRLLVQALCNILLHLRGIPYGRNVDRMAHVEVRRLADLRKPKAMTSAVWLVEAQSRLYSWRTLHGIQVSVSLQSELREFLFSVAQELDSDEDKQRVVTIVSEFMKGWANESYGGDVSRIPGVRELERQRRVVLPDGNTSYSAGFIHKISDLYVVHAAGMEYDEGNRDAGALLLSVLKHINNSWEPEETATVLNADGQAATDMVMYLDGASANTCAMYSSTSVFHKLKGDMLAETSPFPVGEGNTHVDQQLLVRDKLADRADALHAVQAGDSGSESLHKMMAEQARQIAELTKSAHEAEGARREFERHQHRELAALALLTKTQLQNNAPSDMDHAVPSIAKPERSATHHSTIAAVAVDSTRFAQPPQPKPRVGFRNGGGRERPGRLADDVRRKNLGTRNGSPSDRPPPVIVNGVRMRLTDKPPVKYEEVSPQGQRMLAERLSINDAASWQVRGEDVCPMCKAKDHFLKHCVNVWATTTAGQKWLGSTKAAEFVARLSTAGEPNVTMSVQEYLDRLGGGYDDMSAGAQLAYCDNMCYVCEYLDMDLQCDDTPAAGLVALVDSLATATGFADTLQ